MRRTIFAAAAAALLPLGAAAQEGVVRPRTTAEDLQMFSQVLNQIRVNHPDSIDTHRLFMAAVEGMVRAADPHSYVITAARLSPQKEKDFREGRAHPVPIEWDFAGGAPVVRSVAPGSAAARQDILPGDVLVSADGQPVRAESPFELEVVLAMVRQLKGDDAGMLAACREYLARAPRSDPRRAQVEALVATAPEGQ